MTSKTMETHKKFKIEQNALRVYVFVVGIGMTIYCGLLCLGVQHCISEILCVVGAYALLCGGAWMFRLCWLSWAFIGYTFLARLCIILRPEGFFDGEWCGYPVLDIAHYVMFGIGTVLTGYFVCNFGRFMKVFKGENYV